MTIQENTTLRPASETRKIFLFLAALFVLNILLYIGTIHYEFLKDDFRLIVENPRVQDIKTFTQSIGSKFFSFPDYPYLHYWRPVSLFSFLIDYQLWGSNPHGYHLTNILINAFNALLVFLVFYTLFKSITSSFFISLLFSVHPTHVEAVSWISGRTDLLGAFFILSAMLLFILFLKTLRTENALKKKIFLYASTLLLFILGLLSKENSVLFPLMAAGLIAFLFWGEGKIKTLLVRYTLPFWFVDIVYLYLHNRFSGVGKVVAGFSLGDSVSILKTIGAYAKIILMPFFSTFHFSMHRFDRENIEFLAYLGGAVLVLVLMAVMRKKYKTSWFALLFFVFLLPVLNPEIVPSYPKIVIRFAYIPALFAGVFFIDTLNLLDNKSIKKIVIVALALVGITWGVESYRFQEYFKNPYSHYEGLIAQDSEDSSLLLPFALIKAQDGDIATALSLTDRVLEVNKNDRWLDVSDMAGLLKANLLIISKRLEEGKQMAERILSETRKDEMKYFGYLVLSKYYDMSGDYPAAVEMLEKAGGTGETGELYFRKTLLLVKLNKIEEARQSIRKARTFNPTDPKYEKLESLLAMN